MTMTPVQTFIMVLALAAGSAVMRFLPPILFPKGKAYPKLIDELTPMIPPAVIGLLVVYSLKDINFLSGNHGLPELISAAIVALLHLWRKNMLLSVIVGTAVYMALCRVI